MTTDAPGVIFEMDHWGCPFSRFDDGRIAQRPFGGAGYPRTCYGADKTGHYLLHTLVERAYERQVKMYIEVVRDCAHRRRGPLPRRRRLRHDQRRLRRVHAPTPSSWPRAAPAASTATPPTPSSAPAAAPPWPTTPACPLKDMEFVQFHPTGLLTTHILMTRGLPRRGRLPGQRRGRALHGAVRAHRPWSWRRATSPPAPSSTEINEGRGIDGKDYVYLDLRHLGAEKIVERLPGIRDLAIHFEGVDPIDEPIPIRPASTTPWAASTPTWTGAPVLPGFYAAGECACVSVHGANRLGGNSLLETIVFGRRAGRAAVDAPAGGGVAGEAASRAAGGQGRRGAARPRRRGGRAARHAGRLRHPHRDDRHDARLLRRLPRGGAHGRGPREARRAAPPPQATKLRNAGGVFNLDLMRTLELEGMLDVALATAAGALARQESRGSHSRTDYPTRDDARLARAHAAPGTRRDAAAAARATSRCTLGLFEPQERKY